VLSVIPQPRKIMASYSSPTQRILVIGAGELGTAMLDGLARHPKHTASPSTSITVLLRASTIESQDADKQRANAYLRSLGASLTAGDIVHDSEETLADSFRDYDTLIVCSGFGFPAGTQLCIARAALRAGVKRFFPWQWGIDYDVVGAGSAQDLFDEQLEVRNLLRAQSAVDWVVVSTGLFVRYVAGWSLGLVIKTPGTGVVVFFS
jgi:hypothetical protein